MTISDRLIHCRNQEELHPIQRLIWNIRAAIDSQDLIGCYNFCLGLARKILQIYNSIFGGFGAQFFGGSGNE